MAHWRKNQPGSCHQTPDEPESETHGMYFLRELLHEDIADSNLTIELNNYRTVYMCMHVHVVQNDTEDEAHIDMGFLVQNRSCYHCTN